MLICELHTNPSVAGPFICPSKAFLIGHAFGPSSRLSRRKIRVASLTKDQKSYILNTLSKYEFTKESQEVLDWLQGSENSPKFNLSLTKQRARLVDVLGELDSFQELGGLRDESAPPETKKHFLVSFVQKVYTKVLKKERRKFAQDFDEKAKEVSHL